MTDAKDHNTDLENGHADFAKHHENENPPQDMSALRKM